MGKRMNVEKQVSITYSGTIIFFAIGVCVKFLLVKNKNPKKAMIAKERSLRYE